MTSITTTNKKPDSETKQKQSDLATELPVEPIDTPLNETELPKSVDDIVNDNDNSETPSSHDLDDGIIREPQADDQVHLDTVEAITNTIDIYMATTDDRG